MKRGSQRPRIQHAPPAPSSAGQDVIDFAADAGLVLDPWQQHVLKLALGERADGKWSAFEVGLIVSRQNGKGAILEALELAWLFLFEDRLILHSAHEFKTAHEAFLRIRGLIEGSESLKKQVYKIHAAHGEEGIELHDGTRLRFVARSKGSGRGFSADKIILDEAYNLPDSAIDALMPTMGARPNPQIWYTSSAGDMNIAPCDVLGRVRRRGIKGDDPGLAFFEWSVDYDENGKIKGDPGDPRLWAQANPSMGIRKTQERIAKLYASMSAEGFAREELSVGNWPYEDVGERVIPAPVWNSLADDLGSQIVTRPVLAFDMTPDRAHVALVVCGGTADGREQVEVVKHRTTGGWFVDEVKRLVGAHDMAAVLVDARSPAASLVDSLESAGVEVLRVAGAEWVQACGQFYDSAMSTGLRHLDQPELNEAARVAVRRSSLDAWTWDRRKSNGDIAPLCAATLARFGYAAAARTPNYDVLDSIF